MPGNSHVPFGEGPTEKDGVQYLAGGLLNFGPAPVTVSWGRFSLFSRPGCPLSPVLLTSLCFQLHLSCLSPGAEGLLASGPLITLRTGAVAADT